MAYCTIKGEAVGDRMFDRAFLSALTGVPIGISLILLIMLGSLIPARNAILRLLGNVGVLPVRGGAGSIVAAAAMAMRAMNRGGNGGAGAPATTQAEKSIEALEKADASLQESFNESMRNANMLVDGGRFATSDLNDSGLLDIKGEDIDEQLSSGGTGSMGGGASDEEISTGSADDLSSVETGGSDPNSEIDSAMDNTLPDNPDVPDVETGVNGGTDSGEMPSPNSMDDVAIDNGGAVDTNVVGDTSEAIPSGNMVSSEDMAGLDDNTKYHFFGRKLEYNVKGFGDLVNTVAPVHIKQDGVIHNVIAKFVKMPGETEDHIAYGDTLNANGVKLMQSFVGTGYNEEVRYFPDFGARLYFVEKAE